MTTAHLLCLVLLCWLLAGSMLAAGDTRAASSAPSSRLQTPNESASAPPGGTDVIDPAKPMALQSPADAAKLELNVTAPAGAGPSAGPAMRVKVVKVPANPWNVQLAAKTTVAVAKGDVLLASLWVRKTDASEADANFIFELGKTPYSKSADSPIPISDAWRQVFVPFTAQQDFAAGEASVNIQLGMRQQTVELAGVRVIDYGRQLKLSDLPRTSLGYAGRESDASWRLAAAERIDKLRKADLTVLVTDAAGKPVSAATVSVRMIRQAFPFGTAVAAGMIADKSEDGRKYRQFLLDNFNCAVFENDLKWPAWQNAQNRPRTMEAMDWLRQNNFRIRGHCLVWPSWRNLPKDLQDVKDDKQALAKRVAQHVTEEVAACKGRLDEWDVINEPFDNHDIMDVTGNEAMIDWFKLARAADPQAKLFINDYNILAGGGIQKAHQDHYEKTIRMLIDGGAPIDGVGMQGHFGERLTPPERLLEVLDRFAKLGLMIEVTEFDVTADDPQLQADYVRDFYTAVFSHPQVTGILMWGFWEGRHWRPSAAMVARDWRLRPHGKAWQDLVRRQWITSAQGKSDAGGAFALRGFMGDYEITASQGGRTRTVAAKLPAAGARVTLALP